MDGRPICDAAMHKSLTETMRGPQPSDGRHNGVVSVYSDARTGTEFATHARWRTFRSRRAGQGSL